MDVNVLGTKYKLLIKKYDEVDDFKKRSVDGYCDSTLKQIVVCDISTYPGWENEGAEYISAYKKHIIRHEIVHAFLYESGISDSSLVVESPWAENEEMVDWFAIQGSKIYRAWETVGVN